MSTESNINMYYEELVQSLAERAAENIAEWGGDPDESEPIWQALDDGLIYYADQAYIVAHMLQNGVISWGEPISWDQIIDELFDDIVSELEEIKKEKEGA